VYSNMADKNAFRSMVTAMDNVNSFSETNLALYKETCNHFRKQYALQEELLRNLQKLTRASLDNKELYAPKNNVMGHNWQDILKMVDNNYQFESEAIKPMSERVIDSHKELEANLKKIKSEKDKAVKNLKNAYVTHTKIREKYSGYYYEWTQATRQHLPAEKCENLKKKVSLTKLEENEAAAAANRAQEKFYQTELPELLRKYREFNQQAGIFIESRIRDFYSLLVQLLSEKQRLVNDLNSSMAKSDYLLSMEQLKIMEEDKGFSFPHLIEGVEISDAPPTSFYLVTVEEEDSEQPNLVNQSDQNESFQSQMANQGLNQSRSTPGSLSHQSNSKPALAPKPTNIPAPKRPVISGPVSSPVSIPLTGSFGANGNKSHHQASKGTNSIGKRISANVLGKRISANVNNLKNNINSINFLGNNNNTSSNTTTTNNDNSNNETINSIPEIEDTTKTDSGPDPNNDAKNENDSNKRNLNPSSEIPKPPIVSSNNNVNSNSKTFNHMNKFNNNANGFNNKANSFNNNANGFNNKPNTSKPSVTNVNIFNPNPNIINPNTNNLNNNTNIARNINNKPPITGNKNNISNPNVNNIKPPIPANKPTINRFNSNPNNINKTGVKMIAQYDCEPSHNDELAFSEGDILTIMDKSNPLWWKAIDKNGKEGLVPSNYFE